MATFTIKTSRSRDGNLNRTFNASAQRTFDANSTYTNPANLNRSFKTNRSFSIPSNRTYTAKSPIQNASSRRQTTSITSRSGRSGRRAFTELKQNTTFNVGNRPQSKTYDGISTQSYTLNVPNPQNPSSFGPEPPIVNFTDQDKNLLNHIEVVCTEMRSFITSMYIFFCNNQKCNWESVYRLIGEIDLTAQSLLNEIFLQQMRIFDEKEFTAMSTQYDSTSNFLDGLNSQTDSYEDDEEMLFDSIRRRMDNLNISGNSRDSLMEGLVNVRRTETNLRKFNNFENLLNLLNT